MGTRLSKAYLLTKILTASHQEVVVYLYEGVIGCLHRATLALKTDHRDVAAAAVESAISILIELSGGLNYSANSHLAFKLDTIYTYLIHSLTQALSRGDIEAIEASEGVLAILYDAWQQAAALEQKSLPPHPARQLQISA